MFYYLTSMYKFSNNIITKLVYVVQFERGTIKLQL